MDELCGKGDYKSNGNKPVMFSEISEIKDYKKHKVLYWPTEPFL